MDRGAWQAMVHGCYKESDLTEQLSLFFLGPCWGMQDLFLRPGFEPRAPALGAQSLSH